MMEEKDVIKEKLKIELEKLKMTAAVFVLLTGGMTNVSYKLYKNTDLLFNVALFVAGCVALVLCIVYLFVLNRNIKELFNKLGGVK